MFGLFFDKLFFFFCYLLEYIFFNLFLRYIKSLIGCLVINFPHWTLGLSRIAIIYLEIFSLDFRFYVHGCMIVNYHIFFSFISCNVLVVYDTDYFTVTRIKNSINRFLSRNVGVLTFIISTRKPNISQRNVFLNRDVFRIFQIEYCRNI